LLFLDTPPFAANKETVQVLRMHHHLSKTSTYPVPEPMVKFVNGVFRKLSEPLAADIDEMSTDDDIPKQLFGHQLLRESTTSKDNIAPWLLKRWENDWGDDLATLICEEMMPVDESSFTPRIDLSTKYSLGVVLKKQDDEGMMQQMLEELGGDSTLLSQGSIRVGTSLKGDVKSWPGYDDGTWWVQDASSTLPALVLSQALYDKNGSDESVLSDINVVDMCAAPGGKTAALLSAGFGRVTAIEANARRSRRLVENLERLKLSEKCQVVVEEGQNWIPSEKVHGILVDVPCSATGTGARRPDVLRRDPNLKELLTIQEILANHCADNVLDEGGLMVYATCSILKVCLIFIALHCHGLMSLMLSLCSL
jgi:16S rRNA (cytosine967-C5)-methyltransferase